MKHVHALESVTEFGFKVLSTRPKIKQNKDALSNIKNEIYGDSKNVRYPCFSLNA